MRNVKNKITVSLLMSSLFILSGCGGNLNKDVGSLGQSQTPTETSVEINGEETFPLKITHGLGEVTLEKVPENIVVFDYGVLDMLQSLDIPVKGLPKANIPPFLNEFENETYINVGSLKEPDFETVFEMSPDLIIISGRTVEAYEELSKIAPTVYLTIDPEDYMGSVEENGALMGKIFHKEDEVKMKIESLKEKANQIKDIAKEREKKALIILTNDGSISAYGKNSRFGIIHNTLGFGQVDENIETSIHGQNVSFEYLLEKNPDNLFVIDRAQAVGGEIKASSTLENELVKDTKAYRDGNIFYLDPQIWYLSTGGFTSTDLMLDEVMKALDQK